MKKFFLCALILGSLIAPALTDDENCMELYRRDTLETWNIPKGSPLCKVFKPSVSENKYGLQAKDGDLWIVSKGLNTRFWDNYVTEKGTGESFSVSVYKSGLNFSHFITLTPTDDIKKILTVDYEFEEGRYAHYRSRHYVGKEDIKRTGSEMMKMTIYTLCILEALLVVGALFGNLAKLGCVFNTVLLLGLSYLTGRFEWHNSMYYTIMLFALINFALVLGVINSKVGHRLISIAFGVGMVVYYQWGSTRKMYDFFWYAFGILMGVAFLFGILFRTVGGPFDKLQYAGQFGLFWVQVYLFWTFTFSVYPAEVYLRIWLGPADYLNGSEGKAITNYWWAIMVLTITAILSAISGLLRILRDRKATAEVNKHLI